MSAGFCSVFYGWRHTITKKSYREAKNGLFDGFSADWNSSNHILMTAQAPARVRAQWVQIFESGFATERGGAEMQLVGDILHNFAHQISRVAYNSYVILAEEKELIMIECGVAAQHVQVHGAARCNNNNIGTSTCFIRPYPWSMWTMNLAHIVNCIEFGARRTPLEQRKHVRWLLLNAECRCSSKIPFFCPSCSVYCVHARIQEQIQNMIAALIISILHLFVVACCPWAFARI